MLINKLDNVEVNIEDGHKYAIRDIGINENIIKYGEPIGHAVCDIKKGEHVHSHNMKTNLSDKIEYSYTQYEDKRDYIKSDATFMGYKRKDGSVGIRNDIWIVNTVGCVNKTAEKIAALTGARAGWKRRTVRTSFSPTASSSYASTRKARVTRSAPREGSIT